jgi:hypothetical protein
VISLFVQCIVSIFSTPPRPIQTSIIPLPGNVSLILKTRLL